MQTAEDRKCPVLSPSFSSAPGKAGAGLSPWLRGEIPNKRKDLSKGSRRPVGASQTSVGGLDQRVQSRSLCLKEVGAWGSLFLWGAMAGTHLGRRPTAFPGGPRALGSRRSGTKREQVSPPPGVESGAWEEGAALGALQLEAQLLKGQLITQAGQTGWEPHKHEVKCMKGREAGKGPKDVSLPLI